MRQNRLEAYTRLEKERSSKLLVFVTGDKPGMETQISSEMQEYFVHHLDKFNLPKKISVLLYTRGGDTMAAWGIINLIKQFCEEYEVIVPSKARSAGTLICLGAKNVVMTKQATLGPVDPSLNSPLNPQNPQIPQNPQARVPISVESIKGYFEYAKQDLGIKNENDLTRIFLDLSQHVHPVVIGSVFRSRSQIAMLVDRLLSSYITDKAKITQIISFLCSDSGSHDYPIFRREARSSLGLNIETPSMDFYSLIKGIYDDLVEELELHKRFDPGVLVANTNINTYSVRRAIIESVEGGTDVFVSEGQLVKTTVPMPTPAGPPMTRVSIEDQRKFEGWKYEPPTK